MNRELRLASNFIVQNLEAFIWITVIICFTLTPVHSAGHFTICPLSLAGFEHCPGCGLGRAMILLLHGKVTESFNMHPLALFALGIFVIRIVVVFKNYFRFQKQLAAHN